jgi:hypothetical protein
VRDTVQRRRFVGFGLGTPKSGTTSLASLFAQNYRAEHEAEWVDTIETLYAVYRGTMDHAAYGQELVRRDRRLWLEFIGYDEAVEILKKKGSEIQWGGDFGGADETLIGEDFEKPLMVHRFPMAIKAFYMQPDAERPELALGVDVLAPEGYGEIIGGGQRIHDYALLLQKLEEHKLPQEAFEWYLDLRRYGAVPHGGFGMGIERCVAWVCGLEHVRETIAFPRMLYRTRPLAQPGPACRGRGLYSVFSADQHSAPRTLNSQSLGNGMPGPPNWQPATVSDARKLQLNNATHA